jgi:hypothetical protein
MNAADAVVLFDAIGTAAKVRRRLLASARSRIRSRSQRPRTWSV